MCSIPFIKDICSKHVEMVDEWMFKQKLHLYFSCGHRSKQNFPQRGGCWLRNTYSPCETFYFPMWMVSEWWAHAKRTSVSAYERWFRTVSAMWTQDERFIQVILTLCYVSFQEKITNELHIIHSDKPKFIILSDWTISEHWTKGEGKVNAQWANSELFVNSGREWSGLEGANECTVNALWAYWMHWTCMVNMVRSWKIGKVKNIRDWLFRRNGW